MVVNEMHKKQSLDLPYINQEKTQKELNHVNSIVTEARDSM